jgi:methylase of polypeptide subunit release factors
MKYIIILRQIYFSVWTGLIYMDFEYYVTKNGNIYIPEKFRIYTRDRPIREFTDQTLNQHDKVYRHLNKGGVILVNGNWERIKQLYGYISRKHTDIPRNKGRVKISGKRLSNIPLCTHNNLLYRFALFAEKNTVIADPPQHIPYLFNFVGEIENGKKEECYYIPLYEFIKIKESLKKKYYVNAFDGSLTSHYTVLTPASQKIYTLFRSALEALRPSMPQNISLLDMGCGSGVLTFIAAYVLRDRLKTIHATDILQEALASCKFNMDELNVENVINPTKINVLNGGDLFSPIDKEIRYDCILFNPPWTIHKKWSKENKATSDYDFKIINAFLRDAIHYLRVHGTILLFYSDHSGQGAVDTVEDLIKKHGYYIQNRFQEKIRAKGKSKKWEKCFIYQLVTAFCK